MKNKHEILKELKQKCNTLIKIYQKDKKKWLILNTISSFLKKREKFFKNLGVNASLKERNK